MKTIYISPELRVMMMRENIIETSTPDGFHNVVKPEPGLAPEKRGIWG